MAGNSAPVLTNKADCIRGLGLTTQNNLSWDAEALS